MFEPSISPIYTSNCKFKWYSKYRDFHYTLYMSTGEEAVDILYVYKSWFWYGWIVKDLSSKKRFLTKKEAFFYVHKLLCLKADTSINFLSGST